MNILSDPWLPVIRRDKSTDTISFSAITSDSSSNPIIDIVSPRPDIKNALCQLLIGVLQVAMTPENSGRWAQSWQKPPDEEELKKLLNSLIPYFEIDSAGPAFMQDFDLKEGEEKPIASLFIESPGAKTIKDNLDHFTKREAVTALNPYWAAAALYTLQTFAPSGGVGHRVGVRGGGPLTTMVLPNDLPDRPATLWEKLWLNVLPKNDIISTCKSSDHENDNPESIFPWLKPTKVSDCAGSELYPQECHPLHVYFAMPRRIRLCFANEPGTCSLTGKECANVVTGFITKNYGNNYSGPWIHPLNSYRQDPKKLEEPPLSIKGQPGGVHYRHWLGLTLGYENSLPSAVVASLNLDIAKRIVMKIDGTIWAAGYDMDNMKARSWHDSRIPYYILPPDTKKIQSFSNDVTALLKVAEEISKNLRFAVRKSWFKDPNSPAAKKADFSFLDDALTQNTERKFYESIKKLICSDESVETLQEPLFKTIRADAGKEWLQTLQGECRRLFEQWCLNTQEGQKDLRKIFTIRKDLETWIKYGKEVKILSLWFDDTVEKDSTDKNKGKKKKLSSKGGPANV